MRFRILLALAMSAALAAGCTPETAQPVPSAPPVASVTSERPVSVVLTARCPDKSQKLTDFDVLPLKGIFIDRVGKGIKVTAHRGTAFVAQFKCDGLTATVDHTITGTSDYQYELTP